MPKLWQQTIGAHRREVHDTILDVTGALAAERGPLSLTMSEIAEQVGIGRATLYKYFPDVESILLAWHERQVTRHLERLVEIAERSGRASQRLEAVLEAYAHLSHHVHEGDLRHVLHRAGHLHDAHQRLHDLVRTLIAEAARDGDVRQDVPPDELARYCLAALGAARSLSSQAAARRLATVTLAGLRGS
ncbi:MAG: TetR/AcrR family transcriptional regulator [Chloroflexi bacterium]|nr:MAG: TetR/AcrR family transcriptional regulator [Chloroflexota bacterium]